MPGVALAWWLRHSQPDLNQLIAIAYSRQRTIELRIEGAHHAVRRERGVQTSSLSRPQELLVANAQIGKRLREHPGDAWVLQARGRAVLAKT